MLTQWKHLEKQFEYRVTHTWKHTEHWREHSVCVDTINTSGKILLNTFTSGSKGDTTHTLLSSTVKLHVTCFSLTVLP